MADNFFIRAYKNAMSFLAAMSHKGIHYTDEEMKHLIELVESDNIAEAQRLILEKLGKEFSNGR